MCTAKQQINRTDLGKRSHATNCVCHNSQTTHHIASATKVLYFILQDDLHARRHSPAGSAANMASALTAMY
jgi:hypothetical protein